MEVVRDIITSILIIICIIILLSIIFYDKVSLSKVIPESEDYKLSNKMQQELKDKDIDDVQEIIVNYYIDASDLKKYEKTNEYDKGRSDPFAPISIPTKGENNSNNNASSNNSSANNNQNNSSSNFYEDDGTK